MILMGLTATTRGAEKEGAGSAGSSIKLDLGGGVALEAVFIPAGKFLMGRPADAKPYAWSHKNPLFDDRPQHEVTISKAFYLGKYEVTNEQFEKVMGYIPTKDRTPTHPVAGGGFNPKKPVPLPDGLKTGTLTWHDMQTFCKKVSELAGKTVRLPTEAEWEYAARAGGPPTVFDKKSFEESVGPKDLSRTPGPVGQHKPNPWGLYDMFGNVSEWTQDWLSTYTADAVVDPQGPAKPLAGHPHKVVRGGGFYGDYTFAASTAKFAKEPTLSRGDIGFRVVVEIPKKP